MRGSLWGRLLTGGLVLGVGLLSLPLAADDGQGENKAAFLWPWQGERIWDFAGAMAAELRFFPHSPAFSGQKEGAVSPSVWLEPEIYYEWNNGQDRFTFTPFFRWDSDDRERSHIDLRQANWLHIATDWDLIIGVEQVFWGVTESAHLVDVINQIDAVEDIDGEDKLGQLMVNLNLERESGTYSVFILPDFRQRRFPDSRARLRGQYPVDWRQAIFEGGASPGHIDFALRWRHTWGDWDIGLSHFYGVSRQPLMVLALDSGAPRLRPVYRLIHQTGLDLQYTLGAWLWKLEAISRIGHGHHFAAAVGGFEYTVFGVAGGVSDLGVLMEIHLDGRDRDEAPSVIGNHDVFFGLRWALNDEESTEILGGFLADWENGAITASIEASRRIGQNYAIEMTTRLFYNAPESDLLSGLARDDFIRLDLIRYF